MDIPFLTPAFGWVIKTLNNFCGNYMLTLLVFAILVKLLLLPIGINMQKSSIKQAKMRPKEMAIRKKYAGRTDKVTQQKLNEEIMQLYQDEHVNPMASCLPMLIQLPVLFALYGAIVRPLTYISSLGTQTIEFLKSAYNAVTGIVVSNYSEIEIIQSVAKGGETAQKIGEKFVELSGGANWNAVSTGITKLHSSFSVFGIDLTVNPTFSINWYLVIPILTFVFAFLSTKLIRKYTYQPTQADPSQARSLAMMDWMMPLMSVYISFRVSSAIAIYWIYQNILSAAQQILLYKLFPVPQVTDEQIKEAELQMKGKPTKKKAVAASFDDYDDYDKTDIRDKSGSKNKKPDKNSIAARKIGVSPKFVARIKVSGKAPKAKRKI